MKFCEKLVTLRKSNKMSQEQLADMLDISRQAVSKWESGQSYPEMDKLLSLCKIFKCDLNDLTNDEIKEVNNIKKKDAIIGFIDDLLDMFDKSISMFKQMSRKQITTFIFEMLLVLFIILLINIPFRYLCDIPYYILNGINNSITDLLCNLWIFITKLVYAVISIMTIAYIYKKRFLDKFSKEIVNVKTDEKIKEEVNIKSQNPEKIKREYVMSPVFNILSGICIIFVKIMALFIALPLTGIVVGISLFLAISVILILQGIVYFGPFLLCLFALIGCSVFMEILFNFIFGNKSNYKRIFITLLVSVIGFGISAGIIGVEAATTKIIDNVPSNLVQTTKENEYPITDKTFIEPYSYPRFKYEIDDTRKDNFKIVFKYYEKYNEVNTEYYNDTLMFNYNHKNTEVVKEIINFLKIREVYNYNNLYDVDVTIYISSENLQKMKDRNNHNNDINQSYNELLNKYNGLENKYLELENKYNSEVSEYRNKIEQYKNAIKDLDM